MLYTYVPSAIKCYLFGVELKGLSKDNIVSIERISEQTTFLKAQDGSSVAYVDNTTSYRVTIHVEQVSETNDFLHTIYKLHQRVGANLKIPLAVNEKASKGGTEFTAFDCFFESEPSSDFSSSSQSRQWTFICNNSSYSIRGTSDSSFITTALRSTIRMIELSQSAGIDLEKFEALIRVGIDEAQKKLKEMF